MTGSSIKIAVEGVGGAPLQTVVADMISLARRTGTVICCDLNGTYVSLDANSTPDEVRTRYEADAQARSHAVTNRREKV